MPIVTEHNSESINVLSLDLVLGTGIAEADRTNNTQRLNDYVQKGYSLYFPAGDYEINDVLAYPNTAGRVKVWGDGARIYQMTDQRRLLSFDELDGVEVTGLHLHGPYFSRGTPVWNGTSETIVYTARCRNVQIRNNTFEGNSAYAINLLGGSHMSVTDNEFKNGVWDSVGTPASGDIRIERDDTLRAEHINISRNKCNTNTLIGIVSLRPAKHIICRDNEVMTMDAAGNELTAYAPDLRKEGIQLQYHTTLSQGGSSSDDGFYEMEITDNKIQGVRYAAISCQANQATPDAGVVMGIRGNISGNQIRHAGLEQDGNATSTLQGGIVCNTYRDVVIANNVIKAIENVPAPNAGSAAIHVERWADDTGNGTPASCLIQGNIITDCRCRGIRAASPGDLMIQNNTMQNVLGQAIQLYEKTSPPVARTGKCSIQNNRFVSSLNVDGTRVLLGGPANEYLVTGNYLEFTGTWSAGSYAISIAGNKSTVSDNRIIGGGAPGRGILFNTQDQIRFEQMIIAGNTLEDLEYGYFLVGNPDPQRGPMIHHNSTFFNVTNNVWASQRLELISGHWNNTSNQPVNIVCWLEDIPTSGNWLTGDVVWHWSAGSGQPMGWICTGDGQGAAATWIPMANMP